MKAIRYILLSFFQKDFFTSISIFISCLLLFIASGKALDIALGADQDPSVVLAASVFAVIFGVLVIMIHIRSLFSLNSVSLLPLYKEYLIYTIVVVLGFFMLYPTGILMLTGISFARSLALISTFVVLLTYLGLIYGKIGLPIIFLFWPVKFVYEILGFKSKAPFFGNFDILSKIRGTNFVSFFIMIINIILLISIVLYLFRHKDKNIFKTEKNSGDLITKDFDKTDKFINWISVKVLKRKRIRFQEHGRNKRYIITSYLQNSIFSPGISFYIMTVYLTFTYFCYMATYFFVFYGQIVPTGMKLIAIIYLLYISNASMITVDFLQHRSRIMNLYLSCPLDGKKTFLKNVLVAYFRVGIISYAIVSSLSLLILFIIGEFQINMIGQLFLPALVAYIVMIAFSLIFSDIIRSSEAKGWILGGSIVLSILGILLLIVGPYLATISQSIWFHLIIFLISSGLLYFSCKKWVLSELDFIAPDVF
jgi:cbb3-type cytochrome oxidase subunit 3